MADLSTEELNSLTLAISDKPETGESEQIPLRAPTTYKEVHKVSFSPLDGEMPKPLKEFSNQSLDALKEVHVPLEVVFGKTRLSLQELAALNKGDLLPLDDLCDDLVDIYVAHEKIGRGQIVTVDERFAVQIVAFEKK